MLAFPETPSATSVRDMESCEMPMRSLFLALTAAALLTTIGCAPEVGSERWCEKMGETPKGDWSTNDATAYAKHCVF